MFAPEHNERSHPLTEAGSGKTRKLLLALTTSALVLAGAAAPHLFGHDFTRKYAVETIIGVDAAGLSKTERQSAIEEAGKAVRSPANLDGMARTLDLIRDAEFSVAGPSAIGVVSDIMTGKAMTVSAADAVLRERLSSAFTATPDASGRRIVIAVETDDARKSTRIARAVAELYQRELSGAAVRSASAQAENLERAMQGADNAVAEALSKNGGQSQLRRAEEERLTLEQEIATLEASVGQLREDAKTVSGTSSSDVLTKSLSSAFDYSGIDQMRQTHVDAKLLVDQLSASLGPRHPRLLAAQSALTEARGKIDAALMRLSTSLKQQEATAAKELAGLKAKQQKMAAAPPLPEAQALADLQAKAEKARQDYLSSVQRLDATAVAGPIAVKTVAPANAATAEPVGLPMWMLSSIGAALGLGFGLVLAFALPRRPEEDDEYLYAVAEEEDDLFDGEEIDLLQPAPAPAAVRIIEPPALDPAMDPAFDKAASQHDEDEIYRDDHLYDDHDIYAEDEPDDLDEEYRAVAANSSTPLADRVRELLLANRMKEEETHLPPLVAAVMAGGVSVEPHYQREAEEDARQTAALREDIMSLRERVAEFNERRAAGQR
ncbi:uncharacterized protein involved in exopolysaccharide biosynthesis [Neorhizobium huautlense]|uniref:Uncharacterized protein involved in exopolysaccharide biosynthesis n=1 Tax=Neorhizobium huautlense TaxID=67774 RepID=A0ABT9PUB0_9HYPH|nr:hypothetical protein [Neorhizobium huautlense]MDP9837741.1 uncharacterized protein involved in exopolysaccharide biosynthesis [Neorhizobium huautlense]